MVDGVINVYKEKGYTSHDVVAKLRGILHMKRIGHTGTLDPDAVGVLPVCLGKGTKICELITDWNKTYEAVMQLGVVTDTQDMTGKILKESDVDVDEKQIIGAISHFLGDYDQVPPMYSALKVNGKKLYELAREGVEIERKPRRITIYSIHINDINLRDDIKTVTMTVTCSKGTYIRTLCNDIGQMLGCGAAMLKLTRTRVGGFKVDDSLTINQIAAMNIKGQLSEYIVPVDGIFNYDSIQVQSRFDKLLYNGNALPAAMIGEAVYEQAQYKMYDSKGEFIGIYEYKDGVFSPVKMFYSNNKDGE